MFESLSDRLGSVFDKLRGRGALTEADVRSAMREVRVALLEADVALPVARDFVDQVTERAVGQEVLRSVTPGQQVVKIVNDALIEMLGSDASELNLAVNPPADGLNLRLHFVKAPLQITLPKELYRDVSAAPQNPITERLLVGELNLIARSHALGEPR